MVNQKTLFVFLQIKFFLTVWGNKMDNNYVKNILYNFLFGFILGISFGLLFIPLSIKNFNTDRTYFTIINISAFHYIVYILRSGTIGGFIFILIKVIRVFRNKK